jgi:Rho family protein
MPEVQECAPDAQILLVGCKADRRDACPPTYCVPVSEAEAMAATIGACSYVECSSTDRDGVKAAFQLAARACTTSMVENAAKDCTIC